MKYQKLVNDLNNLLDSATKQHHKRQEKLEFYLRQLKAEEKKLRKKLEAKNNKIMRRKLKKDLSLIKNTYAILGS